MPVDIRGLDAAGAAFWSVTRCEHGCVHVNVGRCSITMSPEELMRLRDLLDRAVADLRVRQRISPPAH